VEWSTGCELGEKGKTATDRAVYQVRTMRRILKQKNWVNYVIIQLSLVRKGICNKFLIDTNSGVKWTEQRVE